MAREANFWLSMYAFALKKQFIYTFMYARPFIAAAYARVPRWSSMNILNQTRLDGCNSQKQRDYSHELPAKVVNLSSCTIYITVVWKEWGFANLLTFDFVHHPYLVCILLACHPYILLHF